MKALVLSGGSIKGAYQAGAVAGLLRAGFRPDIITGISVGALNGGFLVSRAARMARATGGVDWPSLGDALVDFWLRRITGPSVLLEKRGTLDLALRIVRKRWAGLVTMDRLYRLVREELASDDFVDPPVRCGFGAVSLETGGIAYRPDDAGAGDAVIDHILASTQEPIIMPLFPIGGERWYDGGVRDLAPLSRAIRLGAREIACVACQPADVGPLGREFNAGDPLHLVARVLEIITNEILNGDLDALLETNRLLREAGPDVPALAGKREIPLLVVRPRAKLAVDITKFGTGEVAGMIGLGGGDAMLRVAEAATAREDPGHAIALALTGGGPGSHLRPAA